MQTTASGNMQTELNPEKKQLWSGLTPGERRDAVFVSSIRRFGKKDDQSDHNCNITYEL